MNTEATTIDQSLSFFDTFNPRPHGASLSPLGSPLRAADSLKILTGTSTSPIDISPLRQDPRNEPSEPIPITIPRHSPSLLSPASAPSSGGPTSYGARATSTSPAMAFLSSFSSPVLRPKPAEGDTVAGYTLAETVGFGGFSTIKRAVSSSGAVVAVKIVPHSSTSAASRKQLEHEVHVWRSLNHEHLLPLFSHHSSSYAQYFFTLFCPAGSLFDILKRNGRPGLPLDEVGTMFRQVVAGLRYLHDSVMLAHRDIKLENVLVDEMGACRISDFGLAKSIGAPQVDKEDILDALPGHSELCTSETVDVAPFISTPSCPLPARRSASKPGGSLNKGPLHLSLHRERRPHAPIRQATESSTASSLHSRHDTLPIFPPGSLPYAAPELLVPQNSFGPILVSAAQDIWALGVLLYALLKGRLPFTDNFEPRLQVKILNGTFDLPSGIGRAAERLLKGCMERSVASRWTIAMVDDVAWGIGSVDGDEVETDPSSTSHPIPSRHESGSVSRSRSRSSRSRVRYSTTTPVSERHNDGPHPYHLPPSPDETHELNHHHPMFNDGDPRTSLSRHESGSSIRTRSSSSRRSDGSQQGRSLLTAAVLASRSFAADDPTCERGRRRHKLYDAAEPPFIHSASRSPSLVPTTPQDPEHPLVDVGSPRSDRIGVAVPFEGPIEEADHEPDDLKAEVHDSQDGDGVLKPKTASPDETSASRTGLHRHISPWVSWPRKSSPSPPRLEGL